MRTGLAEWKGTFVVPDGLPFGCHSHERGNAVVCSWSPTWAGMVPRPPSPGFASLRRPLPPGERQVSPLPPPRERVRVRGFLGARTFCLPLWEGGRSVCRFYAGQRPALPGAPPSPGFASLRRPLPPRERRNLDSCFRRNDTKVPSPGLAFGVASAQTGISGQGRGGREGQGKGQLLRLAEG